MLEALMRLFAKKESQHPFNQLNNNLKDIQTLPDEIILRIFSFLPLLDLNYVGMTCKRFKNISQDQSLWTKFYGIIDPRKNELNKEQLIIRITSLIKLLKSDNYELAFKACIQLSRLKITNLDQSIEYAKRLPLIQDANTPHKSYWDNCFFLASEYLNNNMPIKAELIVSKMNILNTKIRLKKAIFYYYLNHHDFKHALYNLNYLIQITLDGAKIEIFQYFFKALYLNEFTIAFNTLKNLTNKEIKATIAHEIYEALKSQNEDEYIDLVELIISSLDIDKNIIYHNRCIYYSCNNEIDKVIQTVILIDHLWEKINTLNKSIHIFQSMHSTTNIDNLKIYKEKLLSP